MDGAVGVRYTEAGPITYCSPGDLRVDLGDYVVVRAPQGERFGWVVLVPDQVVVADLEGPLRVIDRIASEGDVGAWRAQKTRAEEDTGRAQEVAARSDPNVRVASLDYDLSGTALRITFTAPDRVDPERLRREWAQLFDATVEVERVGDRDRAKAVGGLGVCGLALCCATWMTEFPVISMKMAKEQDLPPNPSKISGVCGRLLCCLTFEVDDYRELRGGLPKVGKKITTPAGRAKVLSISTLKQVVRLRMEETNEVIDIPADELREQYGSAVRPADLEAEIEGPMHDRDQALKDQFLAAIEPVSAHGGRPRPAATTAAPEAPAEQSSRRRSASPESGRSGGGQSGGSKSGGGKSGGRSRGGRSSGGRRPSGERGGNASGRSAAGGTAEARPTDGGTASGRAEGQGAASQSGDGSSGSRKRRRGRRGGRRRGRGGGEGGAGQGGGGEGGSNSGGSNSGGGGSE